MIVTISISVSNKMISGRQRNAFTTAKCVRNTLNTIKLSKLITKSTIKTKPARATLKSLITSHSFLENYLRSIAK